MTDEPGHPHGEQPGPTEIHDPLIRQELKRASVWLGLALAIIGIAFLSQPLLLIVGGLVFASMLDGGTRLLGRVLPIGRGGRRALVSPAALAFPAGTIALAGMQIDHTAGNFREHIPRQANPPPERAAGRR